MEKSSDALRTISEVATELDVPKHVLRFWESKFAQIHPMKRGGGRRYYRPSDVELLKGIQRLLYGEGFTIRGVQQILKRDGVDYVKSYAGEGSDQPKSVEAKEKIKQGRTKRKPVKTVKARDALNTSHPQYQQLSAVLGEIDECRKILHQD